MRDLVRPAGHPFAPPPLNVIAAQPECIFVAPCREDRIKVASGLVMATKELIREIMNKAECR